jgi:hypothetical protein
MTPRVNLKRHEAACADVRNVVPSRSRNVIALWNPAAIEKENTVMVAKAVKAFRTAWPPVGIGLAVTINGVWIAALGYGFSKLF